MAKFCDGATGALKDIDITLVPRVTEEELDGLQKHQVARLSIALDWMLADKAAVEFKPLLSPYGQMFPMASSNRLEVLDAVVNLRELVRLVSRAESDDGRRIRVMEFPLKYRKATEIAVQVRQLVGLPPDGNPSTSTQTQLDIEQARFKAEAVKQLGNNARELLGDKKPDTFLVVNEKENSIVVNAPPDKLEIVRQTIETLDKPLPETESSWQTVSRVKVHSVNGFDLKRSRVCCWLFKNAAISPRRLAFSTKRLTTESLPLRLRKIISRLHN